MSADLKDSAAAQAVRAKDNAALRERLEGMKGEMNGKIGSIMSKMMGIMGADPMELMTDEEIDRLLGATFEKFDYDKSGQLEKPEFIKAWEFLGLKGSVDQITRSFDKVDVDSSGIVDRREFIMAIRDSRLAELSMGVLVEKMDGHLEGLEAFFSDYKRRADEAKKEAMKQMELQQGHFAAYKATQRRRRIMKKQMEENIRQMMSILVTKMCEVNKEPIPDPEGAEFCNA